MNCEICGNELGPGTKVCTFCGSVQGGEGPTRVVGSKRFSHKTVNLEAGMPFVDQALNHLQAVIAEARRLDVQVLTLIHGYGSSGAGGAIRRESRKLLDYMAMQGEVRGIIYGEHFHKRQGGVRDLLRRFPELQRHPHLGRNNRGITLVLLV